MKRKIVGMLTALSMLCPMVFGMASSVSAASSQSEFYRFDFNNSLETTTTDGGLYNKLNIPSGVTEFTQLWGDGTIKFETAKTSPQYYQLQTPITLSHDKPWRIEWRGMTTKDSDNKHSTIFMESSSTTKPWFLINTDNGTVRFCANNTHAETNTTAYEYLKVKTANVYATFIFVNVPQLDGTSRIYYSIADSEYSELSREKFDYSNTDITINYLFGNGYGAAWNYKGEMDYFEVYTDTGSDLLKTINDKVISVSGGEGTVQNPYAASVALPYTTSEITSASLSGLGAVYKLYSDSAFTNEISAADVSCGTNYTLYCSAGNTYYAIDISFSLFLSDDSAKYMFDFNGTLDASEGGRSNALEPVIVNEAGAVNYTDDNTAINVGKEQAGDRDPYAPDGNINDTGYQAAVRYMLKEEIVLNAEDNWEITAKLRSRIKYGGLLSGSANATPAIYVREWKPYWSFTQNNVGINYKLNGTALSNFYYDLKISNTYNAEIGQGSLTTGVKRTDKSEYSISAPIVDNTDYPELTDTSMVIDRFFSNAANAGFVGYVDYIYIDTNTDKTAAVEFLARYNNILRSADPKSFPAVQINAMLSEYNSLTEKAKSYITRGENEIISEIAAEFSGTVEMYKDESNVYIVNINRAISGAKLLICEYADNKLSNVSVTTVNAAAGETFSQALSDYSAAESVKAILIEDFTTIKPLDEYLQIK